MVFETSTLPVGASWEVELPAHFIISTNASITFSRVNGSYAYVIVPPAGYAATPEEGTVVIDGANPAPVNVTFSPAYAVTFQATNLPSGKKWTVEIPDQPACSTKQTACVFAEANGSYSYSVTAPAGYTADPSAGTFTVDGATQTIAVAFSHTQFNVTFVETGLPSGASWWVNIPGEPLLTANATTNFTTIWIYLPNGTYGYSVGAANSSYQGPGGAFTVQGAALTIPVPFATGAQVTFVEADLPAGAYWCVVTVGPTNTTLCTTASSQEAWLVNGNYTYLAYSTDTRYHSVRGPFSVEGVALELLLDFPLVTYRLSFVETGLTSGTCWSVTLNGSNKGACGTTVQFNATNNSYPYVVAPVAGYTVLPRSGTVTVAGAAQTVAVTYTVVTYTVTFNEVGLPSGSSWSVVIAGGPTLSSSGSSVSAALANGTYSYTASAQGTSYTALPGTVTVAGSAVSATVTFYQGVTFTETGLPSGDTWWVTLNGTTKTASSSTINFAPSGSGRYAYTIAASAGLGVDPASGTVAFGTTAIVVDVTIGHPYVVTFGGAASGWNWSVSLGGVTEYGYGPIFFVQPNGSFPWSAGVESGTYDGSPCTLAPSPNSGTVTVKGATTVSVSYPATSTCASGGGCVPLLDPVLVITPCVKPLGKRPLPVIVSHRLGRAPGFEALLLLVAIVVPGVALGRVPPKGGVRRVERR